MFTCVCFESVRSAPSVGILHTMQRRRLTSQIEDSRACFYLEIGKTWVGRAGTTKFRSSTYNTLIHFSIILASQSYYCYWFVYRKPGLCDPLHSIHHYPYNKHITLGAPSHKYHWYFLNNDSKMCLFEREVGRYAIGQGKTLGTIHGR